MVGETIGSYRILGELGQGGMGTVYLAEHRLLQRKAAIKVLLKEFVSRPDLLERFFAEARATSLIEHPGIVQIFDCEVDAQGRPYIVMEYPERRDAGRLPAPPGAAAAGEAVAYARRLAEALAAAHDKGIIHRDIKPDNVFVKAGPPPSVKLVDFGIAKLADEFHAGMKQPHPDRHRHGHAAVHVARAVPGGRARWTTAPTSTRWAACCSRCWPGGRRSSTRVRASWSPPT